MGDSNAAHSRKTTHHKNPVAQNAVGHRCQQKTWGRQQPQSKNSEHDSQQGKTTQLTCETAKNVNGPSQSVVDARAWLSAPYVRPKQKNTRAWVTNPTQQGKEQTMEALREEKQLRFFLWMHL